MRGLGRVAAREHVCRSADRSTDPEHPRSLPREEFVAYSSLDTDLALQFARSVFCARVPVTEDMLVEIIDFLNQLNHEYATGEADYEWSGLSDSCVHTLRNALAAASV